MGVTLKLAGQVGGREGLFLHCLVFALVPSLIKPSLSRLLRVLALCCWLGSNHRPSLWLAFSSSLPVPDFHFRSLTHPCFLESEERGQPQAWDKRQGKTQAATKLLQPQATKTTVSPFP